MVDLEEEVCRLKDLLRRERARMKKARARMKTMEDLLVRLQNRCKRAERRADKATLELEKLVRSLDVDLDELVYVLDKKLISDKSYQDMTEIAPSLPAAKKVSDYRKKLSKDLVDSLEIKPVPNTEDVELNPLKLIVRVLLHRCLDKDDGSAIRVLIAMDGRVSILFFFVILQLILTVCLLCSDQMMI